MTKINKGRNFIRRIIFALLTAFMAYSMTQKMLQPWEIEIIDKFPMKQWNYFTYRSLAIACVFLFLVNIKDTFSSKPSRFMSFFYTFALTSQLSIALSFWHLFLTEPLNIVLDKTQIDLPLVLHFIVLHGLGAFVLIFYGLVFNTVKIVFSIGLMFSHVITAGVFYAELLHYKLHSSLSIYPFMENMNSMEILGVMARNGLLHLVVYLVIYII